jgi:hypothetical protein
MPGRKPLNFAVQAAKAWPQSKKPCRKAPLDRDEKQHQVQAFRPCAQGFALRAQGSKPCGASLDALRAEQKGLRERLFSLPVKRRALAAKLGALPGQFAVAPIEQKASPRHSSG